ncbi:MAG: hypothetical protein Q4E47_02300 [Candidatus Saccharibacteria bacterium]|nr:hypothetical protein [Candidatus Saccharibacteria bacterium]
MTKSVPGLLFRNPDGVFIVAFTLFSMLKRETDIVGTGMFGTVCDVLYYMFFVLILLRAIFSRKDNNEKERVFLKSFTPLLVFYLAVEAIALLFNSDQSLRYGIGSLVKSVMVIVNMIATVVALGCMYYLTKEKVVTYILIGHLINQAVVIIYGFATNDFGYALSDLFSFFSFSETSESIFEMHGATYCIGALLLYFMTKSKTAKTSKAIFILIPLFIIGQKRVAVGAIAAAVLVWCVIRNMKITKKRLMAFSVLFCIVIMIFVFLLYNGTFFNLMKTLGISTSGRGLLAKYFTRQTSFSITQLPWGLDVVNDVLYHTPYTEIAPNYIAVALHNDILKNFIEFGFIGMIAWLYIMIVHFTERIYEGLGERSVKMYIVLLVYTFILFMFSNSYYSSPLFLLMFILPLAISDDRDISHKKRRKGHETK